MSALSILVALLIDKLLAEPTRWHPLVGFGNIAIACETRLNIVTLSDKRRKTNGIVGLLITVLPIVALFWVINQAFSSYPIAYFIFGAVMLYVAVGWQSLIAHAKAVSEPLKSNKLDDARLALSMIVSRDTDQLDETEVAKAATESVLENGADAVFAAIFWFCVLGVPGAVLYRLTNTLDAMWGYKNERFLAFGYGAARLDDVLNFIPARLTALTYALLGNFSLAINCWRQQSYQWKSPNAGPVMAAGAGAINVSLGGDACYHGELQSRPVLGPAPTEYNRASAKSIEHACRLVTRSLFLWLLCIAVLNIAVVTL